MLVNCIEGIQRNHILILHTDKRFLSLTQTTLIRLSPTSFHALRILGLEHSSVVEHLLHMNKTWIQKKNPKKVGKERKEKEDFCTVLCAQKPQLCPSSQGAAMNTAAVTHGKSTKSVKEERLSPVFLLSVLTTVGFAHRCSHLLTEIYPDHYHQSIVARELSNQTEI